MKTAMGKAKKIVIIALAAVSALFIFAAINSGFKEQSKYAGLTEQQIKTINTIKESCQSQIDIASATSDTVGKTIQDRCNQVIDEKIAEFRAKNAT